jgi:hypothetical protein
MINPKQREREGEMKKDRKRMKERKQCTSYPHKKRLV